MTEPTSHTTQKPQRGISLDFYRRATAVNTRGISNRFDRCVLVGMVDYSGTTRRGALGTAQDEPVIDRITGGLAPVADDVPPVWLVLDKYGEGDAYLIPGDPTSDQPPLSIAWSNGGNYAATTHDRFVELLGARVAVRVHDRREGGEPW